MQFVIMKNQQIAIEAENADEALRAVLDGKGTANTATYNINMRPQPTVKAPVVAPAKPASPANP